MAGYILLCVLVIKPIGFLCEHCNSFNNISLLVTTKARNSSNVFEVPSFTGCFEPDKFEYHVEVIEVSDQNINIIADKSIVGMSELKKLSFLGCEISEILPGAFIDLPNLKIFHAKNGNLKTIGAGIFNPIPTLEQLNFKENDISTIADSAFANLISLKEINLSHNDLTVVSNRWFPNSSNIELLDLTYNSLKRIEESTFQETPKLKKILLDFNDIEVIEEHAFRDFREMVYLGLGHNRISELDANIFREGIFVENLSLSVNFLNYLSVQFLKQLKLREIALEGNPWNCLCLNRIHHWLDGIKGKVITSGFCSRTDIPLCIFSIETTPHCIEKVDEDLANEYFQALKVLNPAVDEYCARFD